MSSIGKEGLDKRDCTPPIFMWLMGGYWTGGIGHTREGMGDEAHHLASQARPPRRLGLLSRPPHHTNSPSPPTARKGWRPLQRGCSCRHRPSLAHTVQQGSQPLSPSPPAACAGIQPGISSNGRLCAAAAVIPRPRCRLGLSPRLGVGGALGCQKTTEGGRCVWV